MFFHTFAPTKNYYIMITEINQEIFSFIDTCKTDLDCLKILADFKWNPNSTAFKCSKCGNDRYTTRKKNLARDCNKCHHVESPTAGTLFHKLKFGVRKAFLIIFEMGNSPRAISASQMARKIGITRNTASNFMRKVRKGMDDNPKVNGLPKIKGKVQILTFAFGYKEDFRPKKGWHPSRKKAVVAVEITDKGHIKQMHLKAIENFSSNELRKLFDSYIDKNAKVIVEKWPGFSPLKKDYNFIEKSNSFQNFIQVNRIVHDLKTTLRNTYTSISKKYMQYYLDEFSFKINHSNIKLNIFDVLIKRMVTNKITLNTTI